MANLSSTTIHGNLNVSGSVQIDHVFLATGSGTDINTSSWLDMSWNNTEMEDSPYSFDGTTVTINQDGSYEIVAEMDFSNSGNSRNNPNIGIQRNGNWEGVIGKSGYMRDAEAHNTASSHSRAIISANSGDTIKARAMGSANNSGSYSPDRCQFYIKKLHR